MTDSPFRTASPHTPSTSAQGAASPVHSPGGYNDYPPTGNGANNNGRSQLSRDASLDEDYDADQLDEEIEALERATGGDERAGLQGETSGM